MGTGLTISVGGNDITAYVDARTISIEEVGTERVATCSFQVEDHSGTVSISAKDVVDIRPTGGAASSVLFAGEVSDFKLRRRGLTSYWTVQCHDNNILLDERVIEYEFDASGQADSTIIGDLFSTYRADIDASTYVDTIDAAMEAIRFEDMTLRECMDAICQRTGGRYYVDYAKYLHYFEAESGVNASFGLSTSPDLATTYPFGEFSQMEDGTQILTHVRVIGEDISGWWPTGGSAPDWSSDERHGISYARDVTTQADVEAHGAEVLAAYQNARVTYECICWEDGLRAGQYIPVEHEGLGIDTSYYIRSLRAEFLSTSGDLRRYRLELNTESPDPVRSQHQQFQDRSAIGEVEMPVGHRGWIHDLVFSATDNETVAWTSGTITLADGKTSYSIDAGNVGSIAAVTYIYLDVGTSLTVLQTTTDDTAAIGVNKIMICVCQNVADASKYAQFQVFGGKGLGGTFITADNIAANQITANEIAANTVTAAEIAADTITATEIAAGTITGTEIAAATITADKLVIGDLPFSPDQGLLLLGQPMRFKRGTTNYLVSTRGHQVTVTGAVHPVQGRWQGSQAFRFDPAITNLCVNPSFETGIIGLSEIDTDARQTFAQSTEQAYDRSNSCKIVVTDDTNSAVVYYTTKVSVSASTSYTLSAWVYITSVTGTPSLDLQVYNGAAYVRTVSVNYDTSKLYRWQHVSVTADIAASGEDGVYARVSVCGANEYGTWYIDGVQLEANREATGQCNGALGDGYAWTGTADESTSTRAASYLVLDDFVGLLEDENTWSAAVWVQMPYAYDADWVNDNNQIFDVAKTGDNNNRVYLSYSASTNQIALYINGAVRCTEDSPSFGVGDWLHLIVTLDFTSDDYNLYVNGVLSDNDTTSLTAPSGLTNWDVGANYADGAIGGFAICEFAVFDDVLTATEVAEQYELNRPLIDYGSSDTPGILLTSHSGNRVEITAYEVAVYEDNDKCVEVDSDGIAILVDESYADIRSYQFVDSSAAVISQVEARKNTSGNNHYIHMVANSIASYDSYAVVEAISPAGEIAQAELTAYQAAGSYATVLSYISTGGSEEIWHVVNGTVHTVTDTTGFRVYTKIYGNDDLVFETGGSGTNAFRPDYASGSGYLGDSTYYWNEINYKTLTDRGCLGWFDGGVEMPDGSFVSDLEALKLIEPSDQPSIHGVPQLDYTTFPVACFREGEIAEEDIYQDGELLYKAGEKSGTDGVEISSFLSIILGAVKELSGIDDETRALIDALNARVSALEGV